MLRKFKFKPHWLFLLFVLIVLIISLAVSRG